MDYTLLSYSAALFLSALVGGLATLLRKWSEALLHSFLSVGAGVFLAAVFLHLIPQALSFGHAKEVGVYLLIGYLGLFMVERVLMQATPDGDDRLHGVVSTTALVGLSVHSLIEGLGLAVSFPSEHLIQVLFLSILMHKVPAAFSLASLMILAEHSKRRVVWTMIAFAAMTPLGALALGPILESAGGGALLPLTGIVTGSFLYVATSDILPEVFHHQEGRWRNLILLLSGLVMMLAIDSLFGHSH